MKKILAQFTLFIAFFFGTAQVFSGGPLQLAGPAGRTPVTYPNGGQNIGMNLDQGALGSTVKPKPMRC